MSERDELAQIIEHVDMANGWDPDPDGYKKYGDAILAAGYRKPHTITTAEERSLLLPGTIGVDTRGNAWKRGTGSWVSTGGDTGPLYDEDDIELTILWEPRHDPH